MIELKNIYKSFENKNVLSDLNLNIEKGKSTAIIGPSGCGKSVTLKLIAGLLKPDSGNIFINNKNLASLTYSELVDLRKSLGFLFQGAALFDSMTVFENITLPLVESNFEISKSKLQSKVEHVLELIELPGTENLKPAELSGGMKKRIGLARALITDPQIILYDEPTTGLDPVTSDAIDKLIFNLSNRLNVTSIIVTHDMITVKNIADKVILFHDGKNYFEGTPDELLVNNNSVIKNFVKRTER